MRITRRIRSIAKHHRAVSSLLGRASGLLLGLAAASPAIATVQCGDIIGPNEVVTLESGLSCDDDTGGLTVVGPAVLRMTNTTIICEDRDGDGQLPIGITVVGTRARLIDVSVRNCHTGIFLTGEGRHFIKEMRLGSNLANGMLISSDHNTVRDGLVTVSGIDGIRVDGSRNRLLNNLSHSLNGDDGFDVRGDLNLLRGNESRGNDFGGFEIRGTGNRLIKNNANTNGAEGFDIQGGAKDAVLTKNESERNGAGGFRLTGSGHRLTSNQSMQNQVDGILLSFANDVVARRNTALGNNIGGFPARFDLNDGSTGCGTNTWVANLFDSANQSCIH